MKRIALETERLRLYVALQAEMEQLIERQTDEELKKALSSFPTRRARVGISYRHRYKSANERNYRCNTYPTEYS